jgi:GPI-anchor transamidase subunit GAA1
MHLSYVNQFEEVLKSLHLKTGQQSYVLKEEVSGIAVNGTNVYGILRAPRGDATEAIVLSSSWKTIDGEVDVGGVALLMSLAGYFRRILSYHSLSNSTGWSLWSKDIIFLLVAEPMAGSALWLEAYHSDTPRYTSSLSLKSGEIQAAIQLSHPYGTHFNSISIMYEGTNGQLANLDLINSAVHIAGAQVRVPVTVQGVQTGADRYEDRLRTLGKGMVKQGLGLGMGSGTFGRYKIDAITLQAVGGHGDHDDIAFGRYLPISLYYGEADACRVTESLCRSLNNLLEHLHQSFFFYFLLSPSGTTLGEPGRFVSIGTYLPAAMVLAASFTLTAIGLWMQSEILTSPPLEDSKSKVLKPELKPSMSIGFPLGVVAILHGLGFLVLASFDWIQKTPPVLTPVSRSSFHSNTQVRLNFMPPHSIPRNRHPSHPSSHPTLSDVHFYHPIQHNQSSHQKFLPPSSRDVPFNPLDSKLLPRLLRRRLILPTRIPPTHLKRNSSSRSDHRPDNSGHGIN